MSASRFFGFGCLALAFVSMVWGLPVASKTEKPSSRDSAIYLVLAYILFHLEAR